MAAKNDSSDVSNSYNILMYVSILVIAVSIFYLGFKVTGHATDTAVVNITITSTTAINFTTDFLDFGSGSVNTGATNATVDTDGTVSGGSWSPLSNNFTLENIGNTNVNLSLKVGKTAAAFIGGTSPAYMFKYANKEANSCTNTTSMGTWLSTSTSDTFICSNFSSADTKDTINIGVRLVIPSDSISGTTAQTDTFTATATALP